MFQKNDKEPSGIYEEIFFIERDSVKKQKEYLHFLISGKKIIFIFAFMAAIFLIISSRLFYIQLIDGKENRMLSENNRIKIKPIPSERGKIFDRNGVQLVENVPSFSLNVIVEDFYKDKKNFDNNLNFLSKVLEIGKDELEKKIREFSKYRFEEVNLKNNLTIDKAMELEILSADIPGIRIGVENKRRYLLDGKQGGVATSTPKSMSHILGYLSKIGKEDLDALYSRGYLPTDFIGRTGIESAYEDFLRGSYGRIKKEVDALGREQQIISVDPPFPGSHLELTVNIEMQNNLERIFSENLKKMRKQRGSAIVLNPNNAEVLAMVSFPSYNNNVFAEGISYDEYKKISDDKNNPLLLRAISGLYPTGSIIKPIIAGAALHKGVITKNTVILSKGGLQIASWFFPDWKQGGHGSTDVIKAIAESVNTFFFYVGGGYKDRQGLGVENILDSLSDFGFGNPLGMDIPGEEGGFLPTPEWKVKKKGETWYIGDTYNLSIGQGDILATPLQAVASVAAIANGGTLMSPRVVKSVINPESGTKQEIEPQIIKSGLLDNEAIEIAKTGMAACVVWGSCRGLNIDGAAGKTGTAQWSKQRENHAWFVGFYPVKNPEIAFAFMVEEGGEGSQAALPIARDFLQWRVYSK